MARRAGQTISAWAAPPETSPDPKLDADLRADVCVAGAGIAGLSIAYTLVHEGKSVIVLEADVAGGGETARTTAHLSDALDEGYHEIERLFGQQGSRLAAESHAAAINRIESVIIAEGIECDFARVDGFLFLPPGEAFDELHREMHAAHRAGLDGVEIVARAPLDSFDTGRCLRFPNQAQFDPLKYLHGLRRAFVREGGRIFAKTRVRRVIGGQEPRAETEKGHVVSAGAIVVATNSPTHDNLTIHSKQSPYRTYVIGAEVPAGSVARALYWDTVEPYHYVRLKSGRTAEGGAPEFDLLIAGGEDHRQGEERDTDQRFERLEDWTRKRFPIGNVTYRWSGLVMEPADSLALIGQDPNEKNVYLVTGDSGHGMTHGVIASMLIPDLIAGRENPWESLYAPSRFTAQAVNKYASDTLEIVSSFAEWLTPGEASDSASIAPGLGSVVRRGFGKMAVYRDENGACHESSAICPHLGCIVHWNSTEQSWDCPCHGSRFDPYGSLLRGPAVRGLARD